MAIPRFKEGIPLLETFQDDDDEPWEEQDAPVISSSTRSKVKLTLVIAACVAGILLLLGLAIGIPVGIVLGTSGGRRNEAATSRDSVGYTDSVLWSYNYIPLTPSEPYRSSQRVQTDVLTAEPTQVVHPSLLQTSIGTMPASVEPSLTEVPSPTTEVPSPTTEVPSPTMEVPSPTTEVPSPTMEVPSLTEVPSPTMEVPSLTMEVPSPTMEVPSATAEVPSPTAEVPTPSLSILATPDTQTPLSPTPPPHSLPTLQPCLCQSPRDPRSYELLSLPSGLRVLLISDQDTNISAASMDVATGAFDDPRTAEGLAHFCEHMLFLGTSKYPQEGEYSGYLSSHGGRDNAFTSTQETNYFFTVDSGYLEGALDRFAQFFTSPLFRSDAVFREMHAVNAEHEKNLQSDDWRAWQLLKHVSNPGHPFSMFSTGSIQTLNRSDILQVLVRFYDRHYSANQMQLAIYGRDSIPLLSSWVTKYFSDIKTAPTTSPTVFNTTSFPPPYSGNIIYFRPVADTTRLLLAWQTLPLQYSYRTGVASFLGSLLGSDSAGGISDALKRRGWITKLEAGTLLDTDSYTLFQMTFDLTIAGLAHVSEVVGAVFKYWHLLGGLDQARVLLLWDDFANVSKVRFDYTPKVEPGDYVVGIAKRMRIVGDSEDFLGNPHRLLFNASLLALTMSYIVPNNTVLLLGAQTFNVSGGSAQTLNVSGGSAQTLNVSGGSAQTLNAFSHLGPHSLPWPTQLSQVEPVYGTLFEKVPIPEYLLEFWESVSSDVSFQPPGPNQFIPSDFSILPAPLNTSSVPVKVELESARPATTLWWLQDTEFREPRVNLHCNIWSSTREVSPRWTVLTTLYTTLVRMVLDPHTYTASLTGYTFALDPTPLGLWLHFGLFSDSSVAGRFIEMVVGALSNTTLLNDPVSFSLAKEGLIQNLTTYNYTEAPYIYTLRHIQRVVMERPHWEDWLLLQEAGGATLRDVLDHAYNSLLQNVSLLCFAHGNLNRQQAQLYTRMVAKLPVTWSDVPLRGQPSRTEIRLSPGSNFSVAIAALNPVDRNSVVNVLYQSEPVCTLGDNKRCNEASLMTRAHLGLLEQMISDLCFHELRTVQQLGYVVKCFSAVHTSMIGSFQALVQSIDYPPQRLLQSIESFLHSFLDTYLRNVTQDKGAFSSHVEVLRAKLLRKDLSIDEKTARLWYQIDSGMEQFDWNQQTVDVLAKVSPSSLVEFYRQLVIDSTRYRKLAIVVYGSGKESDLSAFNFTYSLDYSRLDQYKSVLP